MSYFRQCVAVKREKKVLGADVYLSAPAETDNSGKHASPMEDLSYSRFVLTLIDKTGTDVIYPFANIPAADISFIKSVKDIALEQKVLKADGGGSAEPPGDYSNTFAFGALRGKTVLEVYNDSSKGRAELERQREFLEKNAAKFPANRKLIDDITRLLASVDDGTFKSDAGKPSTPVIIPIYEQLYKPLMSRADNEGRPLVYSIRMVCNLNMRYAWEVTIQNGYAPVKETATGSYEVQTSEMVKQVSSSMKMNDAEFCGMVDKLFYCYRDFSSSTFMGRYDLAQEKAWEESQRSR